jgi:hypothetical protein
VSLFSGRLVVTVQESPQRILINISRFSDAMYTKVWYDSNMSPLSEVIQGTPSEQMALSDEEWAQTPRAVQEFVLSLIVRVQALEAVIAALHEQVNRNSRNSLKPPCSDGPEVPPPSHAGVLRAGASAGHSQDTKAQLGNWYRLSK